MVKPSAEIAELKGWLAEQFSGVENKLTEINNRIGNIDGQLFELRERNDHLERENTRMKDRVAELEEEVVRLDAEHRKENLRFYGLPEDKSKTPEDTLRNFIEKDLKVDTKDMHFHAVYRVGKAQTDAAENNQGPQRRNVGRPIFARFALRKDAEAVQRAAYRRPKGSLPKCGVDTDLPTAWFNIRKKAYLPCIKPAKARGQKIRWVGPTLYIDNKKIDLTTTEDTEHRQEDRRVRNTSSDDNADEDENAKTTDPKPQRETRLRGRNKSIVDYIQQKRK